MSKWMPAKVLPTLAGIAASFCVMASANATTLISIGLQEAGFNGGAITTVASGLLEANFAGFYGTYNFNIVSGNGNTAQILDTDSNNTGSGGPLKVYVTEQGLTGGGTFDFTATFTATKGHVTESAFLDNGDGLYALTTLLGSATFPTTGSSTSTASNIAVSSTYSLTHLYVVTGTGTNTIDLSGSCSLCGNTGQTPLPAALPLFGSIFGGGLLLGRLRRRKAKA